MYFRGLLGTAFVFAAASMTSAAVLGLRWRQVELYRAQLNNEYLEILNEMQEITNATLKHAEDLRSKKQEVSLLHETVDVLWADRLARYAQTTRELHSYLKALPEALGVLKSLTSHYQYMAAEMRKFVAFDVACSKVHNLALLLEHGDRVGIHRVAETIRQLFVAEPFVRAVCDSVINGSSDISCPESMNECSASFVYCTQELDRAIEAATVRFLELKSETGKKPPNVFCETIRAAVRYAKFETLSPGDDVQREKQKALLELSRRDVRQLRTTEDLQSAVAYAGDVAGQLCSCNADNSGLHAAVSADAAVGAAVRQLLVWRASAAVFLVQQQAKDALNAYHLLLAETLTKKSLK